MAAGRILTLRSLFAASIGVIVSQVTMALHDARHRQSLRAYKPP